MSGTRTELEVLGGGVHELQGNELETTLLEPADDGADESALDAVRLHAHTQRQGQRELEDVVRDQDRP